MGGTPKSSISMGFSRANHPFWDTSIYGNTRHVPDGKQERLRSSQRQMETSLPKMLPHYQRYQEIFLARKEQPKSWDGCGSDIPNKDLERSHKYGTVLSCPKINIPYLPYVDTLVMSVASVIDAGAQNQRPSS